MTPSDPRPRSESNRHSAVEPPSGSARPPQDETGTLLVTEVQTELTILSSHETRDGITDGIVEIHSHTLQVQTVSGPHPHHHPGVLGMLQGLATIVVVALFVLTFVVQPFRIPSGSMERTLLVGDFLLVDKRVYGSGSTADQLWSGLFPYAPVGHGDVIVFHYPDDPGIFLVKRVIGIPGDHIRLRQGRVYRNGHLLDEPYTVYAQAYPDDYRDNFPSLTDGDAGVDNRWWNQLQHLAADGEIVVPENEYFALGDNRNNSRDSRYWGFVPRQNIVGSPLLVYFSLRDTAGMDAVGREEDGARSRRAGEHAAAPDPASSGLYKGPFVRLPDDRLSHEWSWLGGLTDSVRWDRTLRVIH